MKLRKHYTFEQLLAMNKEYEAIDLQKLLDEMSYIFARTQCGFNIRAVMRIYIDGIIGTHRLCGFNQFAYGIIAVSYTHLDVYKRQAADIGIISAANYIACIEVTDNACNR